MKRYFFTLFRSRATFVVTLLAAAVAYSLITGDGFLNKDADEPTDAGGATGPTTTAGLEVLEVQNKLMVSGDLDRYRIDRLEMDRGDLNVFTSLPFNTASKRKVPKLCEKLIGGEPPLVEVKDFVFVFSRDVEHIRADECDSRHWQESPGPTQ